jgi:hypothetical protein
LIPCSVAQGIYLAGPRKRLNSQMFSGRFFMVIDGIAGNSLLIPCCRTPRTPRNDGRGPLVQSIQLLFGVA